MIHLISTFEPRRIPYIPQFVQHYRQLGVEKFHLSLQLEPDVAPSVAAESESDARGALASVNEQLYAVLVQAFNSLALRLHHDRIVSFVCRPEDWVVWADSDEFQVYPGEFLSLLRFADSVGVDYFRGHFVDRVAEDGRLRKFDPALSIWSQFPRRFKLHPSLAPGISNKVTCARPFVGVSPGNHYPTNDHPLSYYSEPVEVHHFKWDESVTDRLKRRLQPDFQQNCSWWVESRDIIDFIAANDGRIAVE